MTRVSRPLVIAALGAALTACSFLTDLTGFTSADDPPASPSEPGDTGTADGGSPDPEAGPTNSDGAGPTIWITVIGGQTDATTVIPDVYVAQVFDDGSLGSWQASTPIPQGRRRFGLARVGSHLVVGGGDTNGGLVGTTFSASVGPGTVTNWTLYGTATPGAAYFRAGAVSFGNTVYVIGGKSGSGDLARVASAAVASDGSFANFQVETPLPSPRSAAVVTASDRNVYVISGNGPVPDAGSPSTGAGWVGAIATDGSLGSWHDLTPYPQITTAAGGAATSSHVYVSGGYSNGLYNVVKVAPIQSDGSLGTWASAPTMLHQRAGHQIVFAGGHLYAIGGVDENNVSITSVEMADVAADGSLSKWRETTPLPKAISFHGAIAYDVP